MSKHYPWLWFDADGTLFDYDRAESTALRQTFQAVHTPFDDGYLDVYRRINGQLWQSLERQEITSVALRVRRFELLAEALHLSWSPVQVSSAYMEQLALCADLIDGAYDVLRALQARSQIAIVTNGLQAVQRSRLAHSRIRDYITELIISEEVGAAKPHPAFFEAAMARTGHRARSDVLLIGDSLSSDMQGGADYGLDTCWYNPGGEARPGDLHITYEIAQLRELLKVID